MSDFKERKKFSEERLLEIKEKIGALESIKPFQDLCIFVCGSYGRKEAHQGSDLDIFFINYAIEDNPLKKSKLNKVDEILLFADVIKTLETLKFPPLSNDGEFLQIHSLDNILKNLGSPNDDYANYFTTRLLLILESTPIFNKELHQKIIKKSVAKYFIDYEDHSENFKPIFLLNDVIRFWKTMCLNYENKRIKHIENQEEKIKHQLKNLKLKFSRMTICYSMIIPLSSQADEAINEQYIVDLAQRTPLERLEQCARRNECLELYQDIAKKYLYFLNEVSNKDIKEKLKDNDYKDKLFLEAREYSKYIHKYLIKVADDEALRYITI